MKKRTEKKVGSPSLTTDFDPKKLLQDIRRRQHRLHNEPEHILFRFAPKQARSTCMIAMMDIEKYLKAARLQIRRLEGCRRSIARFFEEARKARKSGDFMPKKNRRPNSHSFTEIHFYVICWAAIHSRMKLLKSESGFHSITVAYKKHRVELEKYNKVRDHLEHYVERLPGGRYRLPVPNDLGNLHGNQYSLGGTRWDVSRKSLLRLENIVRDLRKAVRDGTRQAVGLRKIRGHEAWR